VLWCCSGAAGTYIGGWNKGRREGHGSFAITAKRGLLQHGWYEGEWHDDSAHGEGTYTDASAWSFHGQLERGRPLCGVLTERDGLRALRFDVTYETCERCQLEHDPSCSTCRLVHNAPSPATKVAGDPFENLVIGVPKEGRLREHCIKMLTGPRPVGCGLDLHIAEKAAMAHCKDALISIVFLSETEVARRVGQGEIHMGITSQHFLQEAVPDCQVLIDGQPPLRIPRRALGVPKRQVWPETLDRLAALELEVGR
jgi:hypothetical protein